MITILYQISPENSLIHGKKLWIIGKHYSIPIIQLLKMKKETITQNTLKIQNNPILKPLKEGMGFNCKNIKEKKRIWQRLTDAGYRMSTEVSDGALKILFINDMFIDVLWHEGLKYPLNESDFFDDIDEVDEWIPKAGEWVESSHYEHNTLKRQYLCTINGVHICVANGDDIHSSDSFVKIKHISQIKTVTMTLEEIRKTLGIPNLIVTL